MAAGQLAEGLAAAHRRGRVHRDIKPGNLLVGSDMMSRNSGMMGMGPMALDGSRNAAAAPDEELFCYRLRAAISQISDARNAEEKAALLNFTQTALQEQYDVMNLTGRWDERQLMDAARAYRNEP